MSDLYTSSDEEFESADEGEEELSSENVSSSSQAEPVVEDLNNLAVNPPEANDLEEHREEVSKPSTVAVESHERISSKTLLAIDKIEPEDKSQDVGNNSVLAADTEEQNKEITQHRSSKEELKQIEKTWINDSPTVPSENSDLKTQTVGRAPSRGRPTLGAKKLGAVRVSQASVSSAEPETTFSKPTNNKSDIPEVSSSFTKNSPDQVSDESSEWNNSWGWFAPPKSLLSSVTSLTTQILSTVENGLNIPEPEELAKQELELEGNEPTIIEKKEVEQPPETKGLGFGLFGGVSNLTKLVESTSTSLFASGLDTLETIGKKTIDVLQQTDPGFKKTRSVLANPLSGTSQEKVCLSQILREAKDTNESKVIEASSSSSPPPSVPSLSSFIERHYGASHMEALQMLSQQWSTRVAPQVRRLTSQRRVVFEEIARICSETIEAEDEDCSPDDFDAQQLEDSLTSLLDRASLIVPSQKLIDAIREGMLDDDIPEDAYANALDSLALVTSRGIELLRKSGELLLMMPKPSNPASGGKLEAETLNQITNLMLTEITRLGNHRATLLMNHSCTDIFYESANCRSMVQDALKLLIPILQSRVV